MVTSSQLRSSRWVGCGSWEGEGRAVIPGKLHAPGARDPTLPSLHPQAWAKVSGRYEEGSEDPAKWKTNFRCALSSTHMFKLEQDHSKRGDDPHKVFSIVSGEARPMEGRCWVGWAISGPPTPGAFLSATLLHSKEGDCSIPRPEVDQQAAQQQLQVAGWAQQARGVPAATLQALPPSCSPAPGQNVGWGRLGAWPPQQ